MIKSDIVNDKELIELIRSNSPDFDILRIQKAIMMTQQAHDQQKRESGEDYIIHPFNVCRILSEMHADEDTLIAGLLHDTLEDTSLSKHEIEAVFGCDVSRLVEGVSKLKQYPYHSESKRHDNQAENYRKLLLAITQDLRVLLIKLADRLHNLNTLNFKDTESRIRIAKESLEIYAPLANRFGLVKFQRAIEDLSLKYIDPEEYKNIARFLNETKEKRENYIDQLLPLIKEAFIKNEIPAEIKGRAKHIYSIYKKSKHRKVSYHEIYDFVGIRIIVETIEQCYFALAIIHSLFEPTEKKLKDYILRPKANGYQSLHTVVSGTDHQKIEFQIRTQQMHLFAEEGIAAHWRYKNQQNESKSIFKTKRSEENLTWLKEILNHEVARSEEFIQLLRKKLQNDGIVVVSPQNDYIRLPFESSPLDFAFAIHSEVGLHCTGAKVNGKICSLKTKLKDGDQVEIMTSGNANPNKDWLNNLVSHRAKQKLIQYLHKQEKEDAIRIGKQIFEKRCRKLSWKHKKTEDILEIAKAVKINNASTLYYLLGSGKLLFSEIKEAISKQKTSDQESAISSGDHQINDHKNQKVGIILGRINNLMLSFASCCHPQTGDPVIGYISRGRGISIHKKNCHNRSFIQQCESEPERVVDVTWDIPKTMKEETYQNTKIRISGKKRPRLLFDILGIFARYQIQAIELKREIHGHDIQVDYRIEYHFQEEYEKLIQKLKHIPNVDHVAKIV